jgi:hypothetical protein
MDRVSPIVASANYRSTWRAKGHVPGHYIAAVQAVLAELEP